MSKARASLCRTWLAQSPFAFALVLAATFGLNNGAAAMQEHYQLRCTVATNGKAATLDEAAFCAALERDLNAAMPVNFSLVKPDRWAGGGAALDIAVRQTSEQKADVTIAVGIVTGITFAARRTSEITLTSADSPLQPAMARTLVRPVATALGYDQ